MLGRVSRCRRKHGALLYRLSWQCTLTTHGEPVTVQVAVALHDGSIEMWDIVTGKHAPLVRLPTPAVGLALLPASRQLISATEGGAVLLLPLHAKNSKPGAVPAQSQASGTPLVEAGEKLSILRLDSSSRTLFATGGKENMLKLWDIERKEPVWKERNVNSCFCVCFEYIARLASIPLLCTMCLNPAFTC